jgi:hypothetical protein
MREKPSSTIDVGFFTMSELNEPMANQQQSSGAPEDDNPSMGLVKWLIIIGIGVPILVEVGTFFGMVGNHMDEEQKEATHEQAEETYGIHEGARIEVGEDQTVEVENLTLWASSGDWTLQMTFALTDEAESDNAIQIRLDRLVTNHETRLDESRIIDLSSEQPKRTIEWTIPSGEQPARIRIRSGEESHTHRFDKIPVRMQQ